MVEEIEFEAIFADEEVRIIEEFLNVTHFEIGRKDSMSSTKLEKVVVVDKRQRFE